MASRVVIRGPSARAVRVRIEGYTAAAVRRWMAVFRPTVISLARSEILPELKAKVPYRTGRLAASLSIDTRGTLSVVFYGVIGTVGGTRDRVRSTVRQVLHRRLPGIYRRAAVIAGRSL